MTISDASEGVRKADRLPAWLIVFVIGLVFVSLDMADGRLTHGDVDDDLRRLVLHHLLEAGGWFDPALPMIQTPDVYLSPWSRLVDLPYVMLAKIFGLFLAAGPALDLAMLVWPPSMLILFCLLAGFIMRRLNGGTVEPLHAAVAGVAMVVALLEFAPGRIDHHNVQLLAMMLLLAGIVAGGARGGVAAGVATTASVVVGLECLPFIAVAWAVPVLRHIGSGEEMRRFLQAAGVAVLASALACGLAFIGPAAMRSVQCDAYSAPYIAALSGAGLLLAVAPALARGRSGVVRRAAIYLAGAALLAGCLALAFPGCLAGPYQMIDPVSRALWLDRVWQESNAIEYFSEGQIGATVMIACFAALLACGLAMAVRAARSGATGLVAVYLVGLSALLMSLVLVRYVRFPAAFVPLIIPVLLSSLRAYGARSGQRRLAYAVGLPVAPVVGLLGALLVLVPVDPVEPDTIDVMAVDSCKGQNMSVLSAVPPGRILTPVGLGLTIAEERAPGVSVAAIPFHRASPGIRRSLLAFTSHKPAIRRAALSGFDYVAVCTVALPLDRDQAPLYAALAGGEAWPGLVAVDGGAGGRFRLLRIDHAALD